MKLQFQKTDLNYLLRFFLPWVVFCILVVLIGRYGFEGSVHSILFRDPKFFEPWFRGYSMYALVAGGLFFLAGALDYAVFSVTSGTKQTYLDVAPFWILSIPLCVAGYFTWSIFPNNSLHFLAFGVSVGVVIYAGIFSDRGRWSDEDDVDITSFLPIILSIGIAIVWRYTHLSFLYLLALSVAGFVFYLIVRWSTYGKELTYPRISTAMLTLSFCVISVYYSLRLFRTPNITWKETVSVMDSYQKKTSKIPLYEILPDSIKALQDVQISIPGAVEREDRLISAKDDSLKVSLVLLERHTVDSVRFFVPVQASTDFTRRLHKRYWDNSKGGLFSQDRPKKWESNDTALYQLRFL